MNQQFETAFQQGAYARRQGRQLEDNPYNPKTKFAQWKDWNSGWKTESIYAAIKEDPEVLQNYSEGLDGTRD